MKTIRSPLLLLVLLYLGFLSFVAFTYDQLPEQVATHFNARGQANGWMTRSAHIEFMLVLGTAVPLFIIGICYLVRFVPPSLVNLPHREHWLTPERRPETFAHLLRHSLWLACLIQGFVIGVHFLVTSANASQPPHLAAVWLLGITAGFMIGLLAWIFLLLRHFQNAPEAGGAGEAAAPP